MNSSVGMRFGSPLKTSPLPLGLFLYPALSTIKASQFEKTQNSPSNTWKEGMGPILLSKRRPLGIMIKRPKGRASLPQELSAIGHHLVFAEGTKTELSYAKSIEKAILSKYLVDPEVSHVEIIEVDHRKKALDTIRLLDYAEQEIPQRISQGERIDYVWVFFDKDDYHFADFQSAIARIEQKNKVEYQERNLNNDPCDKNG